MKKSALIFTFLSLILVFAVTASIASSTEEVQTEQVVSSDTPDSDCSGKCTPENCNNCADWMDCHKCEAGECKSMEDCMSHAKCSTADASACKHACTK